MPASSYALPSVRVDHANKVKRPQPLGALSSPFPITPGCARVGRRDAPGAPGPQCASACPTKTSYSSLLSCPPIPHPTPLQAEHVLVDMARGDIVAPADLPPPRKQFSGVTTVPKDRVPKVPRGGGGEGGEGGEGEGDAEGWERVR